MHIALHDVDPTALRQLVEYTYTGDITITEDNVQVGWRLHCRHDITLNVNATMLRWTCEHSHSNRKLLLHAGFIAGIQFAANPVGA